MTTPPTTRRRKVTREIRTVPIALGLCRVSTDDQAESGAGLDAQTSTLTLAGERSGWALELHREEGVSAKDMRKRPVLLELLDRLDAGGADILAVAKLDRLSRSVIDFAAILERAKRHGWSVVALDLGVDTSTPTGELVAGVMMQVAQWERRIIGQRTKDALAAKRASGTVLGRKRVLDETTRALILRRADAGMSLRAIADCLNVDQVPTAHGGATWHASTIKAVITSEVLDVMRARNPYQATG